MDKIGRIWYSTYEKRLYFGSIMDMKIRKYIDVAVFLDNVRKCEGNVYFKTIEGDQLNLKSLLSQYILVSIINNEELMEKGAVDCSKASDAALLAQFLD